MRKCVAHPARELAHKPLQCGRIYKDAEIRLARWRDQATHAGLQCGRIYKDAEITGHRIRPVRPRPPSMWPHLYRCGNRSSRQSAPGSFKFLQCGRIYKDAEIRTKNARAFSRTSTFNVAASIKMRKFAYDAAPMTYESHLQCGRIYKDAEMLSCVYPSISSSSPSMWPHL